jgi:hypothetical protein
MFFLFPSHKHYDIMIFIGLTGRVYVVFQTNPETDNSVSRGPTNFRDEYFRLPGVQSRRIMERLNNARGI